MASRQKIRFCAADDGVRIAYATSGSGPALVKAGNWLSHLEYDVDSPVWGHLLDALTAHYTVLRYDQRGTGLSDWDAADMGSFWGRGLMREKRPAGMTFPADARLACHNAQMARIQAALAGLMYAVPAPAASYRAGEAQATLLAA